jgi:hypothetical protein
VLTLDVCWGSNTARFLIERLAIAILVKYLNVTILHFFIILVNTGNYSLGA